MAEVTHSSSSRMAGDSSADHILTSYGYSTNNAVVQIDDGTFDLYLDGQTILSNGDLVIATDNSKKLIFGTDSTKVAQFTTDGAFDLLSGKFLLNGTTGSANQVLKTDGYGNLSWTDQPSQQFAFGGFSVSGQDTVTASNLSETLDIVAGSGISISTDNANNQITITASGTGASEAFKTIAISGQDNVVADTATDTLTLVAGSNVSISTDANADTITIAASTSGDANQNAFATARVTGQNDITADAESSTILFDSEDNTSMDSRYAENRDKVTLETDTSSNKVKLTNNIPKTFSMASKVPVVTQTGENSGLPLRNKFFNVTTSDPVSGGGTSVGLSTRAIPVLQTNGTQQDVLMPAKSDNSTLQLTVLDSSGSDQTIDMEVAE
tara:strand:+ start:801 stop:1949 length:1149 start_codon:yes stop_codon:yes gene_type:complete